jgi:hypothetical protein
MNIEDWIGKIGITVEVMFFAILIYYIGYAGWAEDTADTIILRDDGQSYACQTSSISPAPHNCKPAKEKRS